MSFPLMPIMRSAATADARNRCAIRRLFRSSHGARAITLCRMPIRLSMMVVFMLPVAFPASALADAPAGHAVRMFLERETTGLPGRVAIEFGTLDPQARPAPCPLVEPFRWPDAETASDAAPVVGADEAGAFERELEHRLQRTVESRIAGSIVEVRNQNRNRFVSLRRRRHCALPNEESSDKERQDEQ